MQQRQVNKATSLGVVGVIGAVCLMTFPAQAQEAGGVALLKAFEESLVEAVENSEESVVSIARQKIAVVPQRQGGAFRSDGAVNMDIHDPDFIPNDFGSGIVLGEIRVDGQPVTAILTNYHVVKGAETSTGQARPTSRLSVRFSGRRRGVEGTIWAADPRSDLAIITIQARRLTPIKQATNPTFRKSQFVLTLGNPLAVAHDGGSASVSWGIISNIGRRANREIANPDGTVVEPLQSGNERLHHFGRLLQIDANLNLGMSGGALLNLDGELIGITTSLAALAGYEKSAGYAIPLDDTTRRVIDTLLQGYEVEYGFLGIEFGNRAFMRREGAVVGAVLQNLPASQAKLFDEDVITAVDEHPVRNRNDLMREVGRREPGTTVRLEIYRDPNNEPQYKNVVLGKWPAKNEDEIVAPRSRYGGAWRGLVVDFSSGRSKFIPYPVKENPLPQGVLVTEVLLDSPAERAAFRAGDYITRVNGRPVKTPQEFHRAVQNLEGAVRLERFRNQSTDTVEVTADWERP